MPAAPRVAAALVGVLLAAASTACGTGATSTAGATAAPTVSVSATSLGGESVRLPAAGARVTVVNLWASWCGPCLQEAPALASASSQLAGAPVAFVGLDERDNDAAGRQFASRHGWTYPSVADPLGALAAKIPGIPPAALPVTVVLDRSGAVRWRHVGAVTVTELLAAVRAA